MLKTNLGELDATVTTAMIRCVIAAVAPREEPYPVAILRLAAPREDTRGITEIQSDDGRYLHHYAVGARITPPVDAPEVVWLHCLRHTVADSPAYLRAQNTDLLAAVNIYEGGGQ